MKLKNVIKILKTSKGNMVPGVIEQPGNPNKWVLAADGTIITILPDGKWSNTLNQPDEDSLDYEVRFY
jgi:hypothetical protein